MKTSNSLEMLTKNKKSQANIGNIERKDKIYVLKYRLFRSENKAHTKRRTKEINKQLNLIITCIIANRQLSLKVR